MRWSSASKRSQTVRMSSVATCRNQWRQCLAATPSHMQKPDPQWTWGLACHWVTGLAPSCIGYPREPPHLALHVKTEKIHRWSARKQGLMWMSQHLDSKSLENKLLISQEDWDILLQNSDELRHQGNASLWWHPDQLSPPGFKLLPPLQRWLRDLGNHVHPKQHLRLYLLENSTWDIWC